MIAMLLLRNPTLLRLFLAQALFWSCAMIGITLTSLVGLQLAAAVAFVIGLSNTGINADTVIANPIFMGALLISLAGLATAWSFRAVFVLERIERPNRTKIDKLERNMIDELPKSKQDGPELDPKP